MGDTTERHIALREAHQVAASDAFFAARKDLRDTEHERYIFDAGFRRGFDAHESLQRKATATPPADAALDDVGHNLTQQDVDDISRILRWLEDNPTYPAVSIQRVIERNAELRGIVDALRARQPAKAFTPYTDKELREWYPVMCNTCGWRGLSRDCTGGGPIADTGDFNEITCPKCWNEGEGKAVSPREVVVLEPAQAATECDHCGGTGDVSGEYPGVACQECDGTGKSSAQSPEDMRKTAAYALGLMDAKDMLTAQAVACGEYQELLADLDHSAAVGRVNCGQAATAIRALLAASKGGAE